VRGSPPRHPDEPKAEFSALEGVIQDASELKAGDRVVYPNQGVCAVVGVEVKEIAGQRLELVRMRREEDGAAVMVPKGKVPSVGLRRVASGELMEGVFHYLAAQYDDPELDWKVRHRDNADRLVAGGVLGVAEVVKGLHALSRIRPLPTKEREQYDNARHLLVNEVAVSLGVPPAVAEDFVDYALMPPAGTKFDLKPPPKPILLPSRPKRKRLVADEEGGDGLEGLGLEDLGIDLGEGEAAEGAAEGAEGAEAAEGAEGAEAGAAGAAPAEGAEGPGEEGEAPPPRRPEKKAAAAEPKAARAARVEKAPRPEPEKKPAARPARPEKPEKPVKAVKAEKRAAPAPKAPKAAKPAAKPAAKKAEKPAPRKAGGKKK
jgi:RNA polymerase-interacting CarD/CdnL/TRCF family regulator